MHTGISPMSMIHGLQIPPIVQMTYLCLISSLLSLSACILSQEAEIANRKWFGELKTRQHYFGDALLLSHCWKVG